MEINEPSLKEKVDLLFNEINPEKQKYKFSKPRRLRLPRKTKVNKRRIKKSWIGILRIDENGNLTGEKQQIEDSTIRLKDGTYHTLNGEEIVLLNGKLPIIILPTWKLNPINLKKIANNEKNETYGQKYIMARMLKDAIKIKNKGVSIIIWIVIGIAVLLVINYFMGGGGLSGILGGGA